MIPIARSGQRGDSTRFGLVATFLLSFACATLAQAQAPETILLNGKIVTVDARGSTRQALAIRDGRISAVGSLPARARGSSIFRAVRSFLA
jgi:hypothetical protein